MLHLVLLTSLLWAAAADARPAAQPIRTLKEFRREQVVMQQWDVSCGAAALATILTFQHGDAVPERAIVERLLSWTSPSRVRARGGFSLLELKRFVDERGYVGNGYGNLALANLMQLAPLIVPINTAGYNHFVVFKALAGDRVVLADPAFGNRTMGVRRFESAWVGKLGFAVERGERTSDDVR
jgi:uncharacterized protein